MDIKKVLLPIILASFAATTLTGCFKKDKVGGKQVIQIKAYKGGYSTDFLHKAANQFHKIYPDISVEFLDESSLVDGEKTAAEICVPKKNQVDLYFVTGVDINYLIKRSSAILRDRDATLLEPLDDIFESKAIGENGIEESETIKSRFFTGYEELCRYNGEFPKWRGTMFTLPWAEASTGLFVNKSVLDRYNIEIPLTSNEFTAAVQTISSRGRADNKYPFSWGGANADGYWQYLYETWFAQYTGLENFNRFMNCDPGNGKIVQEGYKVYEDIGIKKALEAMFDVLDLDYGPNGSLSKQHMEAQTDFVTGKTAFMCDGDWILSEMKEYYYNQTKEIMMIGAPVLSSIGEEIGLTDSQLHTLVKSIDEHKTNDEIKALMPSLSDQNIEWVRNARSVHSTIGIGHNIIIPSYADAKDAAKLFVRFFYSNDGCRIFRNYAYSNLPLSYTPQEGDKDTTFQKSLDKVRNYENPQIITTVAPFNGVRITTSPEIYMFNYASWQNPHTFTYIMLDKDKTSPVFTPQYIYEHERDYVRSIWAERMVRIDWL